MSGFGFDSRVGSFFLTKNSMRIFYFAGVAPEELRSHYRNLCKAWHPDLHGGDVKAMQEINAEFQFLIGGGVPSDNTEPKAIRFLGTADGQAVSFGYDTGSLCQTMSEAISFCLGLPDGVEVAQVGQWLWVSGETKPIKEQLKAAGFKWSQHHLKWYFAQETVGRRGFKGSGLYFSDIAGKYGMEKVK